MAILRNGGPELQAVAVKLTLHVKNKAVQLSDWQTVQIAPVFSFFPPLQLICTSSLYTVARSFLSFS